MRMFNHRSRSVRRLLCAAVAAGLAASVCVERVSAQMIEGSVGGGFVLSEGINASTTRIILGLPYSSLDITHGPSVNGTIGVYIGERMELEFIYERQFSSLEISSPSPTRKLANQNVDNYHGAFVYNWGDHDAPFRPFFLFGLGATRYIPGDYDSSLPGASSLARIGSFSKFSSTIGGGVKANVTPHIGIKATARWTPTYIKSDSGGLWCDPFFATCWVLADPDYSNQMSFTGGVTIRFGPR
jgi:hypothetical protein